MARQARIVVAGIAHHVTQRGNYGQEIFSTDDDRRVYLSFLRKSARQCRLTVTAYFLMPNHVHLVAIPEREDSLSGALRRMHTRTGRPLGSDSFLSKIEDFLGRRTRR